MILSEELYTPCCLLRIGNLGCVTKEERGIM